MQFGKNYKQTVIYAVSFDVAFMIAGLFFAYYFGLKPGGTIVLVGVISLLFMFAGKKVFGGKG
jgi:zinc transport system permease protein